MALNANMVWEVRTTGADTNGGAFKTGASGTDWSQQDGTQYAVTDGVTAGTTTITSATANFGTDVVGNLIYVTGGTGSITADWYEITVRTNSTTITVDRSTGLSVGTGATLNIGGALKSPAIPAGKVTTGNDVWIKAGTYSITSASTNVANGCVSAAVGGTSGTNIARWEGYNATRGDKGTSPLLQASGISGATLFAITTAPTAICVDNIAVDGATLGTMTGFSFDSSRSSAIRCTAKNCTVNGMIHPGNSSEFWFYRCTATGCSGTSGFNSGGAGDDFLFCESYGNTCVGFVLGATSASVVFCIASGNTGANIHGFSITSRNGTFTNCIAYGNGAHGFFVNGANGAVVFTNCLGVNNNLTTAGYNFKAGGVTQGAELFNCGGYNTSTGNVDPNLPNNTSFITLTGDPFTNSGTGDFSLNNTASQGAACRAAGYPGLMPRGTSTGYHDIGAVQHADPAGSGGTLSLVGGGLVF